MPDVTIKHPVIEDLTRDVPEGDAAGWFAAGWLPAGEPGDEDEQGSAGEPGS